jgi:hypothetical protein
MAAPIIAALALSKTHAPRKPAEVPQKAASAQILAEFAFP